MGQGWNSIVFGSPLSSQGSPQVLAEGLPGHWIIVKPDGRLLGRMREEDAGFPIEEPPAPEPVVDPDDPDATPDASLELNTL